MRITRRLTRFPFATHVTDFFHVIEHISDALRLLFPDDEARREAQRRSFCHRLKHESGAAAEVLQWLKDSAWVHGDNASKAVLKVVDGHARYIEHQPPFIDYAFDVALIQHKYVVTRAGKRRSRRRDLSTASILWDKDECFRICLCLPSAFRVPL